MTEWTLEAARIALESAVNRAFECGMSKQQIRDEVDYVVDNYEEDAEEAP